jgi:hypothetical protein
MRSINQIIIYFLLTVMALFLMAHSVAAYVMGSSNYRIQTDSVNFGGTEDATSTSYGVRDTMGEIATGPSTGSSYNMFAGYRQMLEAYISITSPADVTLNPNISGSTGGTGSGSTFWTVTTDNTGGYSLTIKSSTDPALQSGGDNFADYTPAGADPDFSWSVAAADSEFGFTPEGGDIVQKYQDNGSACNAGSGNTSDSCWWYFSTSEEAIATANTGNHPTGASTTVKFQAEAGASSSQAAGTYTATIVVTALAL